MSFLLYVLYLTQVSFAQVNFIDLDLKPLKKMVDYYELDKKILNCFIQMQEMEHNDGNAKTIDAIETINIKTIKDCKF